MPSARVAISRLQAGVVSRNRRMNHFPFFSRWRYGLQCSIRRDLRGDGGKPAVGDAQASISRQMELIENSITEQWLAMKSRSRMRVICATPFQKRAVGGRSERFLCCLCTGVQ
jgi:hypothetical protein